MLVVILAARVPVCSRVGYISGEGERVDMKGLTTAQLEEQILVAALRGSQSREFSFQVA